MNKENGYVLLGPEVVKAMLKALDTLALEAANHPTFGHHAEWGELGNICLAMTNEFKDEYPIQGVTHLPVLDDNVEVVTTIYPWGNELVNPPMTNTSWDNILDWVNVNIQCGVIVNVEFTPKEWPKPVK